VIPLNFLKSRKAEKELQMIFGLFILLIISLVVLSLFFKFTEKSSGKLEGASTEYFTKAEKEKAIQACQVLCDGILDDNTLIEFCKKTQAIDWNGDKTLGGKVSWGKWEFCEDTIPCFVLVDNCQQGKYDGIYCKEILSNPDYNSQATYAKLAAGTAADKCGLCSECSNLNCTANWRCKFGYHK